MKFTINGEDVADYAMRVEPTDVSSVPGILPALRGLARWSRAEHVDKVRRPTLRGWVKKLLADYCRRGLEIAELRRELDDDDRPTVAEWDALHANYERGQEIGGQVIAERDEARRDLADLARVTAEREQMIIRLTADLSSARAELDLLRETCHARGEYILLRLSGIHPEVLPVSTWQEDTDGTVVVEARREGGGVK